MSAPRSGSPERLSTVTGTSEGRICGTTSPSASRVPAGWGSVVGTADAASVPAGGEALADGAASVTARSC